MKRFFKLKRDVRRGKRLVDRRYYQNPHELDNPQFWPVQPSR